LHNRITTYIPFLSKKGGAPAAHYHSTVGSEPTVPFQKNGTQKIINYSGISPEQLNELKDPIAKVENN
jgi:hypothetical protein